MRMLKRLTGYHIKIKKRYLKDFSNATTVDRLLSKCI